MECELPSTTEMNLPPPDAHLYQMLPQTALRHHFVIVLLVDLEA